MSKLLFDQNLSPRLVKRLEAEYSDSVHVSQVGLERATDREVWDYARMHDCIIVTKDSDFNDTSVLLGFPPKIVWLRLGNCTTADIERVLREAHSQIDAFSADDAAGVIELF